MHVGNELLKNHATLLQVIYKQFIEQMKSLLVYSKLEIDVEKLATARWLHNQLATSFKHHIAYACKIKKHGTILFRKGKELDALSHALPNQKVSEFNLDPVSEAQPLSDETQRVVLNDLNARVHHLITKLLSQDSASPFDLMSFDVDTFIDSVDPKLWEAICQLTMTITERRRKLKSTASQSVKKLRRLFILCMIMFHTNSRCSMPLHTLM